MTPAIKQMVENGKKNDGAFKDNIKEWPKREINEYQFILSVYPASFKGKKAGQPPIHLLLVSTPASMSSHVAPNLEMVSGEEVVGSTESSGKGSLTYEKCAMTSF